MTFYYSLSTEQIYTPEQMLTLFGINTDSVSLEILNNLGFYLVQQTANLANDFLYSTILTYDVSGSYAYEVWTPVPRSLPIAKDNGKTLANESGTNQLNILYLSTNTSVEILGAVASQLLADRPLVYQEVIDSSVAITTATALKIDAIDAATTVDEINNIVNPPTGTITGSRTGNDFNDSSYVTFVSTSLTEADTELFIPATSTVIPYILPNQFNGTSEAFTIGNYTVQIRQTSTGLVLAEYTCPAGPPDVVVPF